MEFTNLFATVGTTLVNHDAYKARGYDNHKARYAALGCMSGRSQGPTCKWYRNKNGVVLFERIA